MPKILLARLQHYANQELPDIHARFRKGSGTRDQVANIHWIIEKQRNSRKTSTPVSSTMLKTLTVWFVTNCGQLFISVQSLSHVRLLATPWITACQSSLFFSISWSLLKLMSVELVMPSNGLILCLLLLLLPSIFPSIEVFSNESAHYIKWLKYWSFNLSISPSSEYSGLISFRIDWFDLLAVQGTLKSLLQLHSLKASILQHSAFFMDQLSHLYMTTGKIIALTIRFLF